MFLPCRFLPSADDNSDASTIGSLEERIKAALGAVVAARTGSGSPYDSDRSREGGDADGRVVEVGVGLGDDCLTQA